MGILLTSASAVHLQPSACIQTAELNKTFLALYIRLYNSYPAEHLQQNFAHSKCGKLLLNKLILSKDRWSLRYVMLKLKKEQWIQELQMRCMKWKYVILIRIKTGGKGFIFYLLGEIIYFI